MPVPSSIADLSTNPSLNSPAGSESPSTIDDYLRAHAAFIKQVSVDVATLDGQSVKNTGNQTIDGTKTFSASPVVPDATAPKHPATKDQLDAKAPIASPAFTGVPTAPTPTAGTRSQALATMQMFADEFVASLAENGYQKLPSGLIIQWGVTSSIGADDGTTTLFSVAFPNACMAAVACMKNASTGNDDVFARVIAFTKTQITLRSEAAPSGSLSGTRYVQFIAIGW